MPHSWKVLPNKVKTVLKKNMYAPDWIKFREGIEYPKATRKIAWERANNYYLQQWFIRASREKKFLFLSRILGSVQEKNMLKKLIELVTPLSKDFIYAKVQNTKNLYDLVPMREDDRLLNREVLSVVMEDDFKWIKRLSSQGKIDVILNLLNICGSELRTLVVAQAVMIIKMYVGPYSKEKYVRKVVGKTRGDKVKTKNSMALTKALREDLGVGESILLAASNVEEIGESKYKESGMEAAVHNLRVKQKLWDSAIKRLLKAASPETRVQVATTNRDLLQTMPAWVNRRVVRFLDDDTRESLARVDHYWKRTVARVASYETARRQLDEVVGRTGVRPKSVKSTGKVARANRTGGKRRARPGSAPVGAEREKKLQKRAVSAPAVKFAKKNVILSNGQLEEAFLEKIPHSQNPFLRIHSETLITFPHSGDICMSASKRFVAVSKKASIVLHNLITGEPSSIKLSGHTLAVTCLAFHPKSFRIASGSQDKTVKLWNAWSRKCVCTYTGHTGVVLSVAVNDDYVASVSGDGALRVFDQNRENACLALVHSVKSAPTMLSLTTGDLVYFATKSGSVRVFSIAEQTVKIITYAHFRATNYVGLYEPFVVSAGTDNYVRVWMSDFRKQRCIRSFKHPCAVNSAVVCRMCLLTACEDGNLRLWYLFEGNIFRTIQINAFGLPIENLSCQTYDNHIKIICSSQSKIKILEFALKSLENNDLGRNRSTRDYNPYQNLLMQPLNKHLERKKTQRLRTLLYKRCTLTKMREWLQKRKHGETTTALIKNAIEDRRKVEIMPRDVYLSVLNEDHQENLLQNNSRDENSSESLVF